MTRLDDSPFRRTTFIDDIVIAFYRQQKSGRPVDHSTSKYKYLVLTPSGAGSFDDYRSIRSYHAGKHGLFLLYLIDAQIDDPFLDIDLPTVWLRMRYPFEKVKSKISLLTAYNKRVDKAP